MDRTQLQPARVSDKELCPVYLSKRLKKLFRVNNEIAC